MEKRSSESSPDVIDKSRLEFLYDGIFAIAMTILVLEVKVPDLADRHSVRELWGILVEHGSTFFGYFFSFGMLGLFWYRHTRQLEHIRHLTPRILVLHLVQLSMAAFFPFCAGTFGRYPFNYLAMTLYTGCILVYLACATAIWILAKRSGAMAPGLDETHYRRQLRRSLRGLSVISVIFVTYVTMAMTQ